MVVDQHGGDGSIKRQGEVFLVSVYYFDSIMHAALVVNLTVRDNDGSILLINIFVIE